MASPQPSPQPSPLLRLHALDEEDLRLLSACLQDALLRVGDMAYIPAKQRFALIADRFDWTTEASSGGFERARAGVHFETVRNARFKGVPRDYPALALELLAITFEPAQAPGGRLLLNFAGGGAISLEVDCIEAQLCDMGPRWRVSSCPAHALDEGLGSSS